LYVKLQLIRFENEEHDTAKNSSSKMARLQKFEYSKDKFPNTVRSDTVRSTGSVSDVDMDMSYARGVLL
jgi:hypothetical protein